MNGILIELLKDGQSWNDASRLRTQAAWSLTQVRGDVRSEKGHSFPFWGCHWEQSIRRQSKERCYPSLLEIRWKRWRLREREREREWRGMGTQTQPSFLRGWGQWHQCQVLPEYQFSASSWPGQLSNLSYIELNFQSLPTELGCSKGEVGIFFFLNGVRIVACHSAD